MWDSNNNFSLWNILITTICSTTEYFPNKFGIALIENLQYPRPRAIDQPTLPDLVCMNNNC